MAGEFVDGVGLIEEPLTLTLSPEYRGEGTGRKQLSFSCFSLFLTVSYSLDSCDSWFPLLNHFHVSFDCGEFFLRFVKTRFVVTRFGTVVIRSIFPAFFEFSSGILDCFIIDC